MNPHRRPEGEFLGTRLGDAGDALQQSGEAARCVSLELSRLQQEVTRLQAALAASQAREAQVSLLAQRDALTGLPNRVGFESHSRRTLSMHSERARVFGMMFIDLDGFKAVNDRLGHDAGDELLRIIGERLVHAVRRGDMISRHGGDEFLCVLPHLPTPERALAIGHALWRVVAAPCQLRGPSGRQPVSVSPSIGIAMYPRDGSTVGALLRSADHAMFKAKSLRCGVMLAGSPGAHPHSATPAALPALPRGLPVAPAD